MMRLRTCLYICSFISLVIVVALWATSVPWLTDRFPIGTPTQLHLAFGTAPTEMRLSWQVIGKAPNTPVELEYWLDAQGGSIERFKAQVHHQCTYIDSGIHYHTVMTGLVPGELYRYRLGDQEHVFRAARSAEDPKGFVIPVVADMGAGQFGNAEGTLKRLHALKDESDFVLHAGDIGYADDAFLHNWWISPLKEHYEFVYNTFADGISDITSEKAYMVSPGNHESECHSPYCLLRPAYREGLRNFTAYNCRWNMPGSVETGKDHSMWYSFDYGPVHFVSINTETDFPAAEEEDFGDCGWKCHLKAGHFGADKEYLNWLRNDLQKADGNRHNVPWIIAFGHRPFVAYDGLTCMSPSLCESSQSIIDQYVDIVFSGHLHTYSRAAPVSSNKQRSAVYIVTGGAGCDEWASRPLQSTIKGANDRFDWFSFGDEQSVGFLNVTSKYSVEWTAVKSQDGEIIDKLMFDKSSADLSQVQVKKKSEVLSTIYPEDTSASTFTQILNS